MAHVVRKMVESRLRWFGLVWRRLADSVGRRVDHMKSSPMARGRRRLRKTIKTDLEVNGFTVDTIHDRPLWRRVIHVAFRT